MSNLDHYAIVLTINRYPGLSDLDGPENDGKDFIDWLLDPQFGGLDAQRVCTIRSSDYVATTNPDDADPTEAKLKAVLNRWLKNQAKEWLDRLGTRLYLFFAGHGFTAGSSISDPALFSAVAQQGDTAHIAAYRYASKIANAGFFDEIVLVMDCCQDVLKASQVLEPTWTPPDRSRSSEVKLFQAYGAPRGRKSFERAIGAGGASRGLFTSVLMDALRDAPAAADGWVTDYSVKAHFEQLWEQRYKADTGYAPPIRLPDSGTIRLYQRAPQAAGAAPRDAVPTDMPPAPSVAVDLDAVVTELAMPDGDAEAPASPSPVLQDEFLKGQAMILRADLQGLPSSVVNLNPGLHVVLTPEGQPDLVFDVPYSAEGSTTEPSPVAPAPVIVPSVPVEHDRKLPVRLASGPNAEIVVRSADYAVVEQGMGALALELVPGIYRWSVTVGTSTSQSLFVVADAPLDLELRMPVFPSACPLPGTTHADEQASRQAFEWAARRISTEPGDGDVLIFVRDWDDPSGRWTPASLAWWQGASVVRLSGQDPEPLRVHVDIDGYVAFVGSVAPGSLALMIEDPPELFREREERGLIVPVIAGWRTEVYLDGMPADAGASFGRRTVDLASASFHLVRRDSEPLLFSDLGLATEAARAQLAAGGPVAVPDADAIEKSPMWALYAAYAASQNGSHDVAAALVDKLSQVFGGTTALSDVALLAAHAGNRDEAPNLLHLPLFASSWQLSATLGRDAGLSSDLVESIGQWRSSGSLWTTWRWPTEQGEASLRRLSGWRDTSVETMELPTEPPRLDPPWRLDDWAAVREGLLHADRGYSPYQQALRRRLLNAVQEGALPESDAFDLADELMLSHAYAANAYEELYRRSVALMSARYMDGQQGAFMEAD